MEEQLAACWLLAVMGADGLVIEGRLEGRGCGCLVRTVHAFVKKH
jgi:hypothetical protein